MKTRVLPASVFSALLLTLAAEGLGFLPAACAQSAQAAAAVSAQSGTAVGLQRLRDHVPAVLARLQPIGRLATTDRLKLAVGLPLRNQPALAQLQIGRAHV